MNKAKIPALNYGTILMWTAALVASPRYAGAFLAADAVSLSPAASSILHVANVLSGAAMGILEVVATAYLLDSLREMKPLTKANKINIHYYGTLGFAVALLILSPAILAPYVVARMTGAGMADALIGTMARYAWAIAVVVAPIIVVGGVAFARAGIVGRVEAAPKPVPAPAPAPLTSPVRNEGNNRPPRTPQPAAPASDWRLLPTSEKARLLDLTTGEIAKKYNVNDSTARRWRRSALQLTVAQNGNGHVQETAK